MLAPMRRGRADTPALVLQRGLLTAWAWLRAKALRLPDDYEAFAAVVANDPLLRSQRAGSPYMGEVVMMIDGGYKLANEDVLTEPTIMVLRALARACRDDVGHDDFGVSYAMQLPALPASATLRAKEWTDGAQKRQAMARATARLLRHAGEREAAGVVLKMAGVGK